MSQALQAPVLKWMTHGLFNLDQLTSLLMAPIYALLLNNTSNPVTAPATYMNAIINDPAVRIGAVATTSATTCNIVKRKANGKKAL
jgi:hypothetical protein